MPRTIHNQPAVKPLGLGSGNTQMLPPDHPCNAPKLREHDENSCRPQMTSGSKLSGLANGAIANERRDKSSRTLMSFLERDKCNPIKKADRPGQSHMHTRSKSSTSIPNLFSRQVYSKDKKQGDHSEEKDKENRSPPHAPIWAQFATQHVPEPPNNLKIPLNDSRTLEEEARLYSPEDYSPSKQRHYHFNEQPTLTKRPQQKSRPKSECLSGNDSQNVLSDANRKMLRRQSQDNGKREIAKNPKSHSSEKSKDLFAKQNTDTPNAGSQLTINKRNSRVMAAVAMFNGKSRDQPKETTDPCESHQLDSETLESAFESLLVGCRLDSSLITPRLMDP